MCLEKGTFNTTGDPATKALLNTNTFSTVGNRIKIYDYVTSEGTVTEHIDDFITPYNEGTTNTPNHPDFDPVLHWPFVGQNHQWCPGVHKFFGWLAEDANMTSTTDAAANTPEEFFGSGFTFDETSHILTIPQKAMTIDTPQFDFMYSNIHTRDMDATPDYSPVPLEFSHLFSAFCITGANKVATNSITITRVTISGLNNTQSAVISYAGDQPSVTYTDTGANATFDFTIADGTLSTEAKNLTSTYLMWPQAAENFADAKMVVYYTYTADGKTTNEERELLLTSLTAWDAGIIKKINIVFDVKQITFIIEELVAWNPEEKDIPVQM